MTIIILAGVVILGGLIYAIQKSKVQSTTDDMFISTTGESLERVKHLNLDNPSEDASYILDKNKLEQKEEYKANRDREWIIELIKLNQETFKMKDLNKIFDFEWRSNFQSSIFGFSPEENRWTYANLGEAQGTYTKIQIAVDIQQTYTHDQNYSPKKLNGYVAELENRIQDYPSPIKIETKQIY